MVMDRVHSLKNVNQLLSKAGVELSAMEIELSAAEVGPSAAEAELSTWEVVLSAAEVRVSTAKLVFSPQSKKSSSLKKQLAASEYQIVEASQSSCVATCQSASTKASPASCSGASQAIYLPEPITLLSFSELGTHR